MKTTILLASALIAPLALSTTQAHAQTRQVSLDSGAVIPVLLDKDLSSRTAHTGDRFSATVRYGDEDAGMPQGTRIEGVIREVQRFENGKPGVLDLDFRRMVTPGGQSRPISGSLIALNGKTTTSSDGRLTATGDKNAERNKFIGIGAGSGLLIGALAKKDALVSTILGAGAGYLFNEFANKPKTGDVNLKSGTEFGIRLDRGLTFQSNQAMGDSHRSEKASVQTISDDRYSNNETYNKNYQDIGMLIDGQEVVFWSAKPFMRSGQVMMPLDSVSQAANFTYSYNRSSHLLTACNSALRMDINSRVAVMNGRRYLLPVACELRDATVYAPLQFLNIVTGGTTVWDADSRTAILTTKRQR
ncbi:stalk domain-containing protein [Armatimonas sp.]|uniref:stalk domain-containing protein n=1 Tax=Armatimonas sp. TaxID=1872638 RepID=UPI0037510053